MCRRNGVNTESVGPNCTTLNSTEWSSTRQLHCFNTASHPARLNAAPSTQHSTRTRTHCMKSDPSPSSDSSHPGAHIRLGCGSRPCGATAPSSRALTLAGTARDALPPPPHEVASGCVAKSITCAGRDSLHPPVPCAQLAFGPAPDPEPEAPWPTPTAAGTAPVTLLSAPETRGAAWAAATAEAPATSGGRSSMVSRRNRQTSMHRCALAGVKSWTLAVPCPGLGGLPFPIPTHL